MTFFRVSRSSGLLRGLAVLTFFAVTSGIVWLGIRQYDRPALFLFAIALLFSAALALRLGGRGDERRPAPGKRQEGN